MSDIIDIAIIGGGPAGLSAGIYGARAGYRTVMIEKMGTGGQMLLTDIIDNYPGFEDGIAGYELQDKLVKQATKFGLEIVYETVTGITKADKFFDIKTESNILRAKSVIIASGAKHRELGTKGEAEFAAKGVSYCGTCDAPFFRDKSVIVIGGGDSALTEALFIAKFAKDIKIIHRKDRFRAVKSLIDQCTNSGKIEFIFNTVVEEIVGNTKVTGVRLLDSTTGKISEIQADGVFIFVGLIPNTEFVDRSILDQSGYIITSKHMQTGIEGLFAAGDVRSDAFRQVVCACSDGAFAAESSGKYIDQIEGNEYK